MDEFIQEQVELIENEFPEIDQDRLYQLTWDALQKIDADVYDCMETYNKIGYLQYWIEVMTGGIDPDPIYS